MYGVRVGRREGIGLFDLTARVGTDMIPKHDVFSFLEHEWEREGEHRELRKVFWISIGVR